MKSKNICQILLFMLLLSQPIIGQVQDSISISNEKENVSSEGNSLKDHYLFVYDGLYDMIGSGKDFLSISHLFGRGLDELTCHPNENTGIYTCFEKKNFLERILIDGVNFIFTNWLSTAQHECMGHGFRAREFNARINQYYIEPGIFGGEARVDFNREDLPYYGLLLEEAGGSESNTVFSRESFRQSLINDNFYHYYFYSFVLKIDLPMYILGGTPEVGSNDWINPTQGRDVIRYIKAFKSKSNDDEQQIYKSAQKGAYWSLADPSLLISLYNYFRDYFVEGKAQVENPMIKINDFSFLPFTDFHLSPFGDEYYIGSYVKYHKILYEVYCRWASGNIDGESFGVGVSISNLTQFQNFRCDAGFDLWKQGFNLLYYDKDDHKYREGVISENVYVNILYQLDKTFSLFGQVSYKGEGYLMGRPVQSGFNGKIGVDFYF